MAGRCPPLKREGHFPYREEWVVAGQPVVCGGDAEWGIPLVGASWVTAVPTSAVQAFDNRPFQIKRCASELGGSTRSAGLPQGTQWHAEVLAMGRTTPQGLGDTGTPGAPEECPLKVALSGLGGASCRARGVTVGVQAGRRSLARALLNGSTPRWTVNLIRKRRERAAWWWWPDKASVPRVQIRGVSVLYCDLRIFRWIVLTNLGAADQGLPFEYTPGRRKELGANARAKRQFLRIAAAHTRRFFTAMRRGGWAQEEK